jgi:hypothetical protein
MRWCAGVWSGKSDRSAEVEPLKIGHMSKGYASTISMVRGRGVRVPSGNS